MFFETVIYSLSEYPKNNVNIINRCCASLEARIHRVRKGVRVVLDLFIDDDVGASEATIPFNYMPVGAPGSSRGMLQDNCQLGDEAFKVVHKIVFL